MKVVLWANLGRAEMVERLGRVRGLEVAVVESVEELAAALPGAGILAMGQNLYGASAAEAVRTHGRSVRFFQILTAGIDGPQAHGVPAGIVTANVGDVLSPALAEMAMALLFACTRRLAEVVDNHRAHGWSRSFTARTDGLDGKTVAIIGYGGIGQAFAQRAAPFGMRVIGVSRTARHKPYADELKPVSELREVLSRADVVLLTAPLTPETHHLMGREELSACKRGAVLINVARGGLVDQVALREALETGQLSGAGLDATDPEPLPPDDPLWDSPNLIIAPHVGGAAGKAVRTRLANFVGDNIERYLAGQPVLAAVEL